LRKVYVNTFLPEKSLISETGKFQGHVHNGPFISYADTRNKEEDTDDPEQADERDIQMEYSSD